MPIRIRGRVRGVGLRPFAWTLAQRHGVRGEVPNDRDGVLIGAQCWMSELEICADCRAKYEDPGDRRCHARLVACPACGPSLWHGFLEYLLRYAHDDTLEPRLLERREASEDATRHTLNVRPDATWHTGQHLTAEHAAAIIA